MITLAPVEERVFTEWGELRDVVLTRKCREYCVNSSDIELTDKGIVCADKFEGPIIASAFIGLLKMLGIPVDYATHVCPPHLLKINVKELGQFQNTDLRVVTVNDVVHAVMPVYRLPIRHHDLIEWLDREVPLCEAILAGDVLRITSIRDKDREVLPSDFFGLGWEIISSESGWGSTSASRFAVRLVCTNGMLGIDKVASVRRHYNSNKPVLETLEKLTQLLAVASMPAEFEAAVGWATKIPIGRNYEPAMDYLSQRLEGDATKSALSQLTDSNSWYDLVNSVTALTKTHQLVMRRRYEFEGGLIMSWFDEQGRINPPWRKKICKKCNVRNAEQS